MLIFIIGQQLPRFAWDQLQVAKSWCSALHLLGKLSCWQDTLQLGLEEGKTVKGFKQGCTFAPDVFIVYAE